MLVLRCAYGKLLQGVGQLWGACRCRGSIRMEPVIPVSGIVKDVSSNLAGTHQGPLELRSFSSSTIGNDSTTIKAVKLLLFSVLRRLLPWWWFSRSVVSISCSLMDCSPPGSSVHGISQARTLEWAAVPFSGDLPNPQSNPGLLRCRQIEPPGKPETPFERKQLRSQRELGN